MAGDVPGTSRAVRGVPAGREPAADAVTALIVMDDGGVIVDFDQAAERLFGYSRQEARDARLSELIIPARLRAAHEAGLARRRRTGVPPLVRDRFVMQAMRRDGTEIQVELTVTAVRLDDGRDGFAGTLRPLADPPPVPVEIAMSARFYRALIEQSPQIVAVIDADGRQVWSSPASVEVFGEPAARSGNRWTGELVHPADRDRLATALDGVRGTGRTEPVEIRLRDRDGRWRELCLVARDVLTDAAVHGTALYLTDASRARAAERQARIHSTRIMTLIDSIGVGVLLQDEQRRVVLANDAFVEMLDLGLAPDRLRGAVLRESPDGLGRTLVEGEQQRLDDSIRRGRPLAGQEVALPSGRVLERDYTPVTMDGATLGHLWVFRDVTAQAEIRRGLEERNRSLSELSTLKTEFVAVVSHELRTPLTSIATFANMLDEEGEELTPEVRAAAVGAIRRNADRMLGLVSDLILLAKLESGEMTLASAPVNVGRLVRDAVSGAAQLARDGLAIRVEVADGGPLTGDESLLGQLFEMVIRVVAAASVTGAEITVCADPEPTGWYVRVVTSAADATTAERLQSTRLPHPVATGELRTGALAMMLARAIASRHGGSVEMALNRPGATVTVRLSHSGTTGSQPARNLSH